MSIKGTKSDKWRTIDISASLADLLQKQIKQKKMDMLNSAELWEGGDHFFLISDDLGKAFRPDAISKRWRRFRQRYDIRPLQFHALRHTNATWLLNKGVPVKTIQERLGHADIKTTLNVYSHVLQDTHKEIADMFNTFEETN